MLFRSLARYLKGHELKHVACLAEPLGRIDAFSDSDWMGCSETKIDQRCGHHVRWLVGDEFFEHSAGLAGDVFSRSRASSRRTGSLGEDMKVEIVGTPRLWMDSKAALGAAQRLGPGRMRHLEAKQLLIQEMVKDGSIQVSQVSTLSNPADIYTKHLKAEDMQKHLLTLGFIEKVLGFMVERASWAKPWKKPKMANAIICCLALATAAAGDTMEDDSDGSTAFWKIMLIWTLACITVGMFVGALMWAKCCSKVHGRVSRTRAIQTDEVPEVQGPRRTIILQKPEAVYDTPNGEKMHLSLDCRHVRGRATKVHEVCRDCQR